MPKKLDRCVRKVSKKKGKKAAFAICTSSIKNSKKLSKASRRGSGIFSNKDLRRGYMEIKA